MFHYTVSVLLISLSSIRNVPPPPRLFNNSDFIIRVEQRVGRELNGTMSIRIVILKFQKMG